MENEAGMENGLRAGKTDRYRYRPRYRLERMLIRVRCFWRIGFSHLSALYQRSSMTRVACKSGSVSESGSKKDRFSTWVQGSRLKTPSTFQNGLTLFSIDLPKTAGFPGFLNTRSGGLKVRNPPSSPKNTPFPSPFVPSCLCEKTPGSGCYMHT